MLVGFFVVVAAFWVPVFVADVCPDFVFVFFAVLTVVWDPESPVFEGAWVFCAGAEKGGVSISSA